MLAVDKAAIEEDCSGDEGEDAFQDGDGDDGQGEPGTGPYATLSEQGPVHSLGSSDHPDECQPCTFYCFTRRGCNRGLECKFCHLAHQSKLQLRRESWKKQQREKRKALRERTSAEVVTRRSCDRGGYDDRRPLAADGAGRNDRARPNGKGVPWAPRACRAALVPRAGGEPSGGKPAVLYYEPGSAVLCVGQEVELQPIMSGVPTSWRLASPLPQGLTLDPLSGTISGTATAAHPPTTVTVEMDTLGGQLHATVDLEVVDFTRGGYVVGHLDEVEPGRFMMLLYVPDDTSRGDAVGPAAGDQRVNFPLLRPAHAQPAGYAAQKPRTHDAPPRRQQQGGAEGSQGHDWW